MSRAEQTPHRGLNTAIADAVVQKLQEYTGRGATRARAIVDQEAIIVILEDTLTKGEQVLVDNGRQEEVLSIRRTFQETMRTDLVEIAETLTGREVRAFMSANHTLPDCSAEIFLLGEPLAVKLPEALPAD